MSHALFPPSSTDRWMKCPHSVMLAQMFVSTDTAASSEGTKKHEEAATHLENGTDSDNRKLQTYIDFVRKQPGELMVERKVHIVPGLCWGTSDAIVINPAERFVFVGDLKWGKHPVKAVNNSQLKTYSLGVLREFPMPKDTEVQMAIIQPNAKSGPSIKPWKTSVERLLDFRVEVLEAIDRGLNDNGPETAVAGSHCFWCPGKLHCDTYLKY